MVTFNNQRYDFMLDQFEDFCNTNKISSICVDRTGIGDMFAEYAVTRMEGTPTNVIPVFITHQTRESVLNGISKGFKEHSFSIDKKYRYIKTGHNGLSFNEVWFVYEV